MPDKDTLDYYDGAAQDYQRRMANTEFPYAQDFADQFQTGQKILDFGCGPGHHSAYFATRDLRVDALDASSEMIALASKHQGVAARVASFEDLTDIDLYDGIWANFSLLHAKRTEMPAILDRLQTALKPDGLLHIGLKTGTGEKTDSLGRFYTYYQQAELSDLLATAGFKVTRQETGKGKGMAGQVEPWVILWSKATKKEV